MEFTAATGETLTGEVWSPGPVPRSVWVLTSTRPYAVRLPEKGKPAREVTLQQKRWNAKTSQNEPVPWTPEYGRSRLPFRGERLAARHAPPLSRADWRRALGQTA